MSFTASVTKPYLGLEKEKDIAKAIVDRMVWLIRQQGEVIEDNSRPPTHRRNLAAIADGGNLYFGEVHSWASIRVAVIKAEERTPPYILMFTSNHTDLTGFVYGEMAKFAREIIISGRVLKEKDSNYQEPTYDDGMGVNQRLNVGNLSALLEAMDETHQRSAAYKAEFGLTELYAAKGF